jgi:hypothetical protein
MKLFAIIISLMLGLTSFAHQDKEGEKQTETEENVSVSTMIKGQIIDKTTGDALTGVTVRLNDGSETYTDFDGNFVFQNIKPGKYKIQTSYISYENAMFENINCESSEVKTLQIQLKNL